MAAVKRNHDDCPKVCLTCAHHKKGEYACIRVIKCKKPTGWKLYEPAEPVTDIAYFAEVAEKSVTNEARRSAERIAQRNAQELIKADSEDFWAWWGASSPPDNKAKEIKPPGPPIFKGGSKNRSKRKKKPVSDFRKRYMML